MSDLREWQVHNSLTCRRRTCETGLGERRLWEQVTWTREAAKTWEVCLLMAQLCIEWWPWWYMSLSCPSSIQPGAEDQLALILYFFCHRCDWLFSAHYKTCGEDCYYLALFMCSIQRPLPNNISSREMGTWGGENQSQTKSERKSQEQNYVSQPIFI